MSSKQGNYREVLAVFVGKIPHAKGWWYRLPSRVATNQDGQPLAFDAILPHMGTLFGLTELARPCGRSCTKWAAIKKVMVLLSIFKVGMI
jgi:hypothetical protein